MRLGNTGTADMNDSMRASLDGLLDEYDVRRNREVSARNAEQAERARFAADATAALDAVIAPCFASFAEALKAHHHACTIERGQHDESDMHGEGHIQLTIFPDGTTLPQGNASLSYVASAHRRKFNAHRSVTTRSGGLIPGTIGVYELAQITPALVNQHLLELAQAVFTPA
jgi:hypothetical protein